MTASCSNYKDKWLEIFNPKKLLPVAFGFIILHLFYWISHHFFIDFFVEITQEDGFFEYVQASLYFGSSIIFGLLFIRQKNNNIFKVWAMLFAFGYLFIAGEEISWGQRLFGFQVEIVEKFNVQKEFNLHNISYLPFSPNRLLTIISLGYGVFLPILISSNRFFKEIIIDKYEFPVVHPVVTICFTLSYLWYYLYHQNSTFPTSVEESREASISIGFFVSAILIYREKTKSMKLKN